MSVSDFQPVIGLEVHAQLLTRSKIFCGCSTEFGAPPNANTCAVCLGMPGVLPVLNEKVVEFAVRAGRALECRINPVSIWSRKNYFYPDLPKGYQISQYDQPLCEHGALEIDGDGGPRKIRILRIHLEEDAGKNVHDAGGGESLVDLNRSGVPLVEIVSEPDLRSSAEAAEYLKSLRDVLVYLGVNDGNLEEGSFRCDANVSVMPRGATKYGQRVELKNINSFRFVQKAIDYEIGRQVELIESGGKVAQETRLFDAVRGETRSMRSKEEAHDYRYFPEPDLPPLRIPAGYVERIERDLPELPRAKLQRFTGDLRAAGVRREDPGQRPGAGRLLREGPVGVRRGGEEARQLVHRRAAPAAQGGVERSRCAQVLARPVRGVAEARRRGGAVEQRSQGRLRRDVPHRPRAEGHRPGEGTHPGPGLGCRRVRGGRGAGGEPRRGGEVPGRARSRCSASSSAR